VAAATVIAVATTVVSGQSTSHYGSLDATDKTELTQWATHYWARVDAGTLVTPSTFSFTKAALNDPLFMPVRGARRTLETIGAMNAQACDGLAELQVGFGDVGVSDAFREAMTLWKFRTDAVANPTGTQVHLNLVSTAPSTSNTTWGMEGSYLVSTNLPWETLTGANPAGQIAATVSPGTLNTIGKMVDAAPAIAKAAKGVTQTQSLITGDKSHADRFEQGIVQFLADQMSNASAWRVDAAFGVFGSLPLVGVTFDDAFVLVDSTNGAVDGPFDLVSPLDATVLLAQHSAYAAGSTVRYVNFGGCSAIFPPTWRTRTPGSPMWPGTPLPPWPLLPGTPTVPPGGPANYTCLPAGAGCRCERLDIRPPVGGQPAYATRTVCHHTAGCGPAGGTCPTTPQIPNPATGDTPTVAACPPPVCHVEYFY